MVSSVILPEFFSEEYDHNVHFPYCEEHSKSGYVRTNIFNVEFVHDWFPDIHFSTCRIITRCVLPSGVLLKLSHTTLYHISLSPF